MSNSKYVENKNVESKNVGVGGGARVWVKARGVCLFIYFHSQLFSLSAFVPFLFSTFIFSTFLLSTLFGGIKVYGMQFISEELSKILNSTNIFAMFRIVHE
jgi:hypothetical protein